MSELSPQQTWQAALGELELMLSKANFTTWFKQTTVTSVGDGRVVIAVPTDFTKNYLEKKYHAAILKSLQNVLSVPLKEVTYVVDPRLEGRRGMLAGAPSAEPAAEKLSLAPPPPKEPVNEYGLRPSYTFESFIVGKGNELAHAAAQAVAEHPGQKYNPLFLYGGVGLGKTHLLHAIGHEILKTRPGTRVLCVTCEQFMNDFINAVRAGKGKELKDRYRNVDVLLVDDIQFITGKKETQEEFFHTFNALHQANKQVVLTSDRPPKAIATLEDRMRTRLEWGMMADVAAPDLETRVAILKSKCADLHALVPDEVLHEIATLVQSNVRELEGALTKITAYHQLKNSVPTLDSARAMLSGFSAQSSKKSLTARALISTVANYFDLTTEDLLGQSRAKKLSHPRQIVMYLMREEMRSSYPAIGTELGGRDHTTAMHACDKITRLAEADEKLRTDLALIRERLFAGG